MSSSRHTMKAVFFSVFRFDQYSKPQQPEKVRLRERLVRRGMDCQCLGKEARAQIETLWTTKKPVDMLREQQDSISEAMRLHLEWEQSRKQRDSRTSRSNSNSNEHREHR